MATTILMSTVTAISMGCLILVQLANSNNVTFSAGFTNDAVLQRSDTDGVSIYGFCNSTTSLGVLVTGTNGKGVAVSYEALTNIVPWDPVQYHPSTAPEPPHGSFTWHAKLSAADAGGNYTITASDGTKNGTATIERITFGDVFFCSGQSNMALETYYTFSADTLKSEIAMGKFLNLRHFMFGSMGLHYEATKPQWVTSYNTGDGFTWHNVSSSAALPLLNNTTKQHSPFAKFAATCMYFGVELITERIKNGIDADVPIGLIQSAIGGSQIESWMSNETLSLCKNESQSGGAIPQDSGALYYGMVCPFVNYSVSGWVWYQGENNCYGDMGNSYTGVGYGCELPAMVQSWRDVWQAAARAVFGVATIAAGGSEGNGQHMGGLRWSQTANYGVLPNPKMPRAFVAQVYDLGDPWAAFDDGNNDPWNCSKQNQETGQYGANCTKWDPSKWGTALEPFAQLVRDNDPSGVVGNNFMGGIHPRLKRPVGRRLAMAAQALMNDSVLTGPTISGCTIDVGANKIKLMFNKTLLGADSVLLRQFDTNMSGWSGVDSLGAMVCTGPTSSAPTPATCQGKCEASGHCCMGNQSSCNQLPSCGQGCDIAKAGATLEQCQSTCVSAQHECTFKYKNLTFGTCAGCCKWLPGQLRPQGMSPSSACSPSNIGGCLQGCAYAYGAAVAPLFPQANATTCACQTWSSVPCDGGVKGQSNKWPCDPVNRTGTVFWYCEDGPGWKPPPALRERGKQLSRAHMLEKQRIRNTHTTINNNIINYNNNNNDNNNADVNSDGAIAMLSSSSSLSSSQSSKLSQPSTPRNPFETLWKAAPLLTNDQHSVIVDLSGDVFKGTEVFAVRYAWPMGDDGDTCCPNADVSQAHLSVCIPGSCPLFSLQSQLPANPFFARITQNKCACELPQVCDAIV